MYYYVLNEHNTVLNSIVLEGGVDPTEFGAIADERVFNIGDTWTPTPTEMELIQQDITEMNLNQIEQGQMLTELHLMQLEGGKAGVWEHQGPV